MRRILDQLDLIIFGVVLVSTCWIVTTGMGSGRDLRDDAVRNAEAAIARLERVRDTDRYGDDSGATTLEILAGIPADVERQWSVKATARPYAAGVFYHEATLEDLREGRDLELRFQPPANLHAEAEIGLVRLTWSKDERTTVEVVGWVLYRSEAGGADEVIARLPADRTAWEDQGVRAGSHYAYRVAAVTDEPLLVERGRTESERSRVAAVQGKKDYEILLLDADLGAATARVRVRKYERGLWHEKDFDVRAGEEVGTEDPGSGVRYQTGCRAQSLVARTESVSETRDEIQFDERARVVLQDGSPVTRSRTFERPLEVVTLTFVNEVGAAEKLELRRAKQL